MAIRLQEMHPALVRRRERINGPLQRFNGSQEDFAFFRFFRIPFHAG